MTIVYRTPATPEEGSIVYARGRSSVFKDAREKHIERAIYKNGRFMAGGDLPIRSFEISDVDAWVYQSDMLKTSPTGFGSRDVEALMGLEPIESE